MDMAHSSRRMLALLAVEMVPCQQHRQRHDHQSDGQKALENAVHAVLPEIRHGILCHGEGIQHQKRFENRIIHGLCTVPNHQHRLQQDGCPFVHPLAPDRAGKTAQRTRRQGKQQREPESAVKQRSLCPDLHHTFHPQNGPDKKRRTKQPFLLLQFFKKLLHGESFPNHTISRYRHRHRQIATNLSSKYTANPRTSQHQIGYISG